MTLEQMRQRMYVDGWCVIEDVIPPGEIDAVHDSVLRTVDTYKHTRKNAPANIGAVSGMIVYDQSFAPYLAEPRLLRLAASLLGSDLRISFNSSIVNYPGTSAPSGTRTGRSINRMPVTFPRPIRTRCAI